MNLADAMRERIIMRALLLFSQVLAYSKSVRGLANEIAHEAGNLKRQKLVRSTSTPKGRNFPKDWMA
jgi:hypothetical protein